MSFVSLYHKYTVVFIYCCRKISLEYLTASYNPHFHPETNTLKILWQKQNKKYPTNPQIQRQKHSEHSDCLYLKN
ncbi:rCG51959 [Rattus norvegicus]|uniref:RCG51959 n=1 Tax=Rattus norvegicus TaxID=10116 RepID=A6K313_RAT|nr:rCG51959 [Rattus norvegicus]